MSKQKQWAHERRALSCGHCGARLGYAFWQIEELIVVDGQDRQVSPARGADLLAEAMRQSQDASAEAEVAALDHDRQRRDPADWQTRFAAAEDAAQEALRRVQYLRSDSHELMYEWRCPNCPATPRRTAVHLAAEVVDSPGELLALT